MTKPKNVASNFATVPNSGFVNIETVTGLFSVSPATVWRWISEGAFPAPVRIGSNTTRWNAGKLRAYIAELNAQEWDPSNVNNPKRGKETTS